MPHPHWLYRSLVRTADLLLPAARPFSAKFSRGDRARRGALTRWLAWARDVRDPGRPLLWVHAPSVGEGLQGAAVIAAFRERHPDWQIVATCFSPSAEALAPTHPADRFDFLPYDTAPNAESMMAALRPAVVAFVKADVWPGFATAARRAGARVALVAGTVSPVSGRRHPVARWLTRAGYRALDRAGAIAEADAQGLAELGVAAESIEVTGDPRFDSAWARARAFPADWPLRRLTAGAPTLVAGSTWPADEAVLLPAFAAVRTRHPAARLVVAPHEPTERQLALTERRAAAAGLTATRLSRLGDSVADLVAVDQTGVLAGLYSGAAVAWVGGGFGTAGLHSVLEPAAAGVPVLFGPRWQSSREAGLLQQAGAATALADRDALVQAWERWLADPAARAQAATAATAVVEAGLGAARRNALLLERLAPPSAKGPGRK